MKPGYSTGGLIACSLLALLLSSTALAQIDPTWVKEGVEWSKYDKFIVQPLDVSDARVVKPPYAADDPSSWDLEIEDLALMQAIFRDVMNDEIEEKGGYPLVYAAGDGVLEVEVEVLTITPWLKPGGDRSLEGYTVKTLGSGELTARVAIRDSKSRELLLLIEGDTAVGERYKEFTPANNVANVESMFRQFASNLRTAMDRVHGK